MQTKTLNQLVTGSSPVRVTAMRRELMTPVTLVTWIFAPEWLTLDEAARLSGYDEARLLELIADGDIEAELSASGWLIEKSSLRELKEMLLLLELQTID